MKNRINKPKNRKYNSYKIITDKSFVSQIKNSSKTGNKCVEENLKTKAKQQAPITNTKKHGCQMEECDRPIEISRKVW